MLIQAKLALKPDGLLMGTMLGGTTLQELRSALLLAQRERLGTVEPLVSPFTTVQDLGDILSRVGFTLVTCDSEVLTVDYPNVPTLLEHVAQMGEANAPHSGCRPLSREVALAVGPIYDALYGEPVTESHGHKGHVVTDITVPASFEVIHFVAWSPGPDQPQPMPRYVNDSIRIIMALFRQPQSMYTMFTTKIRPCPYALSQFFRVAVPPTPT